MRVISNQIRLIGVQVQRLVLKCRPETTDPERRPILIANLQQTDTVEEKGLQLHLE